MVRYSRRQDRRSLAWVAIIFFPYEQFTNVPSAKEKPAPTVSALTQQLNGLLKKHGGGAASTPGSRSSATRSAPASHSRGTPRSKAGSDKFGAGKRTYQDDSDDAEEDDEDTIKRFKPSPSATPAPRRANKRARNDSPVFIKNEEGTFIDLSAASDDDTPSKSSRAHERRMATGRSATLTQQQKVCHSQLARAGCMYG